MKVLCKNKGGTKDRECSCGSWKKHWENFSGQTWPEKCVVDGCNNEAAVGAHIIKADGSKDEFIVPMCEKCNSREGTFYIEKTNLCVPANKSKTCDK